MSRKVRNKIIGTILCIVTAFVAIPYPMISQASDEQDLTARKYIVYEEITNVSSYRGETKTAPSQDGYVFAGWYEKDGETYTALTEAEADKVSSAYAKFVDEDAFGFKVQLTAGTSKNSATTDLRMVTTVDTLNYKSVGFQVRINGKTVACVSDTVYPQIQAFVNEQKVAYEPTVFSEAAAYFATHRITGIPNSMFRTPIVIRPTWTTFDGTVVEAKEDFAKAITVAECVEEGTGYLEEGLTFEKETDMQYVSGYTGSNTYHATNISCEEYDGSTRVAVRPVNFDSDGGGYPHFYLNLGKTYPAGSVITYYFRYNGAASQSLVVTGYKDGVAVTDGVQADTWAEKNYTYPAKKIILLKECDAIDIWFTMKADTVVYYDNFKIVEPVDLEAGVDFEKEKDMNCVSADNGSFGSGHATTISRAEYAGSTRLAVKTTKDGGSYPTIHLALGKTYPAGTKITFWTKLVGTKSASFAVAGYNGSSKLSGAATMGDTWLENNFEYTAKTITLNQPCDKIAIYTTVWSMSDTLYYDNFCIATEADFDKGVDFEHAYANSPVVACPGSPTADYKSCWGQTSMSITRTYFDGSYVMKGTTAKQYPEIHVNLGKTYESGSTLAFRVYIEGKADKGQTVKAFLDAGLVGNSENSKRYSLTNWKVNEWNEVVVTFEKAHDHLCVFPQLEGVSLIANGKSVNIYYDDFHFVKEADFEETVDFERLYSTNPVVGSTGSSSRFGGQWGQSAINLSKTTFEHSTVLVGTTRNQYPEILVELGHKYQIGSKISFRVYVQGEVTDDSVVKGQMRTFVGNSLQGTVYTAQNIKINEWNTLTVTLTQACDRFGYYIQFERESVIADGKCVNIYYDDFEVLATADFERGVNFEKDADVKALVGTSAGDEQSQFAISKVAFDGSYTMSGTTNKQYPMVTAKLERLYPAGTKLKFKVYVAGDAGTDTDFAVGLGAVSEGKTVGGFAFNQWNLVTVTLDQDMSEVPLYVVLAGKNVISGSNTARIYFDDFYTQEDISDVAESVTTGQTVYVGAMKEEQVLGIQLYDQDQTLLGTLTENDITLAKALNSTYGIYSYQVTDAVKYVFVPSEYRGSTFGVVTKDANDTASIDAIEKEMKEKFSIEKPSEDAVNALKGKKALFVGDSITAGVCDDNSIYDCKGWAGRIGYYADMDAVTNNGVSGACITTAKWDPNNPATDKMYIYKNLVRAKETGYTYDYVIMHGLINDFYVNGNDKLGAITGPANFDPTKADASTFAGALELLFYTAKEQNQSAKLGFIVNYNVDHNAKTYVDMAIAICEAWDIDYLDLFSDGTKVDLADGLHPTSKGYDEIYARIADWMSEIQ